MIIKEEQWGIIPILHIVEDEFKEQDVPVVIFHHGFTSAKEHNLHYAYNLAKQGVRVLLPDAHLHGARDKGLDEVQMALSFWEIVMTSIEELAYLREELNSRGLVKTAKVGIGGTSMGGIVSLGSLKIYEWIDATIVMMGAPGFVELAKGQIEQFEQAGYKIPVTDAEREQLLEGLATLDLTKDSAALAKRPIYFWHGKKDPTVPYKPTYKFYESVKTDYADVPERLVFVTDKQAGHSVTRGGMLGAVNWLASNLNV